jgi:hypothetical protein
VNFRTMIYENHPTLIVELAKRCSARREAGNESSTSCALQRGQLVAEGLLKPPCTQFVLGIPNALPADRQVLEFELEQLERMPPGAT